MNEDLLLVALLAFTSGYILKGLMHGFKTFSATAHLVEKIGRQSLVLLATSVYKMSYVDQICVSMLEKVGKTEEAKQLRLQHQQEFDDWKQEAIKEYKESYPPGYEWQLEFDDWKGMMDELTHIYKEKKV